MLRAQVQSANASAIGQGVGSLTALAAAAMIFSNPDLKTDIAPASDDEALKATRKLPIYTWRYKHEKQKRLGGMTPDMPDSVIVGDLDTRLGYDPISYLGMLTGAVRALDKQVQRRPRFQRRRKA